MNAVIITANLGNFDPPGEWAEQPGVPLVCFTDENFPPRSKSMTPRLQARIPKMFGWEMAPGFDTYIWCDASFAMQRPDSVAWLLDRMGDADMALFLHPDRRTIRDEHGFIKAKLAAGNRYLTDRYAGELLDEQLTAVTPDGYIDDTLYASCSFAYRNVPWVRECLRAWWFHTSRYHTVDQLALPFVVRQFLSGRIVQIKENIYKTPYLTYIRNQR